MEIAEWSIHTNFSLFDAGLHYSHAHSGNFTPWEVPGEAQGEINLSHR